MTHGTNQRTDVRQGGAWRLCGAFAVAAVIILAPMACAHGGGAHAAADCRLAARDTVYLQSGPVYRDCAVDQRARLITRGPHIDYRPTNPPRLGGTTCYSVALQFVVGPTGVPEKATARVLQTNDPPFAQAVVESLGGWRYEPATKDGQAVRQIVRERQAIGVTVAIAGSGRPTGTPPCR